MSGYGLAKYAWRRRRRERDRIVSLKNELQWFSHQITTTAEVTVGINANELELVMSSKDTFFNLKILRRIWALTAVVVKASLLWVIMTCNPLKVTRRFGGINLVLLWSWIVDQARNQHESSSNQGSLICVSSIFVPFRQLTVLKQSMFLISWFGNGEVRLFATKPSLIHSTKQTNWSYCVPKVLEERKSRDSAVRKEPKWPVE
jgi:hypothetical protein